MTRVQIGELRDRVSHYVRRAERGETIVILNRAREVALLSPCRQRPMRSARLLGYLKGTASVRGDIVSPIIAEDERGLGCTRGMTARYRPDARRLERLRREAEAMHGSLRPVQAGVYQMGEV
jgi:prevent-host-death family protein